MKQVMAKLVGNRESLSPETNATFVEDDRPPCGGIAKRVERALEIREGAPLNRPDGVGWEPGGGQVRCDRLDIDREPGGPRDRTPELRYLDCPALRGPVLFDQPFVFAITSSICLMVSLFLSSIDWYFLKKALSVADASVSVSSASR
jgi:hypothetical protein